MDENQNNKYELIDGYAVVDNNFEIITANEALYKFIGVSIKYTIMNVIHQVDIDDFIDEVMLGMESISKDSLFDNLSR